MTQTAEFNAAQTALADPIRIGLAELIAQRGLLVQQRRHQRQQALSRAAAEGGYRARARGRGMTFAEVRAYQPGDDVRLIDWRVTARTGKTHTKVFDEERERPVLVALDYRRPMFFATRGSFKVVQGARLAALLGWQALQQNDRFGAFLFSEEHTLGLRPQLGKDAVLRVLREMVASPVWERERHLPFAPRQRLEETLGQMHRVVRPGSFVVLISDCSHWNGGVEKQITLLTRHSELCLVHCYDPFEAALPALPAGGEDGLALSDGSGRVRLHVGRREQHAYQQHFATQQQRLESFCLTHGADYVPYTTTAAAVDCVERVRPSRGFLGGRR
ncbi:MAG: DUF58 domain-containing protein [Desulfuromonas sp.]